MKDDVKHYDIYRRLLCVKKWLEINPHYQVTTLRVKNNNYFKNIPLKNKSKIKELSRLISKKPNSFKAFEKRISDLSSDGAVSVKEKRAMQFGFFKDIYNLLFGKDSGPHIAQFLWLANNCQIQDLLHFEE